MIEKPTQNDRRLRRLDTPPMDVSDWMSRAWKAPAPKRSLIERLVIDGHVVSIVAVLTSAVALAVWAGFWLLGLDLLARNAFEFAVGVAATTFALAAFLLAR